MLRIKVCGLNDPHNVKEIAEAGPDFMGFIFYEGSQRFVGADPEINIFRTVPAGIRRVGVFLNEKPHKIIDLSSRYGLDMIQLHGNESPMMCLQLKSAGLTTIKTFSIDEDFNFEIVKQYMPGSDYFLFDTKSDKPGGSGKKFSWKKIGEYTLNKPFFLSGGIGPEDAALLKLLPDNGLFAVDINSRFESSPGVKDVNLVKQIINTIKMMNDEY
jgi:phosphoribosylanthranilate isomerase